MPVFISHRSTDSDAALKVSLRLRAHGIDTYLDVLDPELQGVENVTQRILDGLRRCTHLLAVISTATAGSWWVPFEIGVATDAEQRITSYALSAVSLPDYLRIWPVLTRDEHIDLFARRYLEDKVVLEKSWKLSEARATAIRDASDFHRFLKRDLQLF